MATIHIESSSGFPSETITSQENSLRRPLFPAVRWGAVLAGVAVGVSVQLVLTLLGIASGLSLSSLSAIEGPATGALVWAGLSMLIAALIGTYVAGRMSGLKRKTDGVLHGVVTWAVTTLLFVFLATSAGGSLLSGLFSSLNPGTTSAQGSSITNLINRQMGTNVSPESLSTLQAHISAGRRDQAINQMSSTMGVQRDRAAGIVDQALILSGSPEQASPAGRETANRAIQRAGNAAWIAFGAVALAFALSLLGGALGAMGARRITWTESVDGTTMKRTESGIL
jgi:hypothetical protein